MLGVNVLQPQESFGQQLGTNLGQGLQMLASHKLNDVMQKKQVAEHAKLWASLGANPQTAHAFASAPESLQKELLERFQGQVAGNQGNEQDQMQQQSQQQMEGQPQQQMQPQYDQQGNQIQQPAQQAGGFIIGPTKEERRHRELLNEQKLARHSKENAAMFKETAAYRTELNNKAEAAEGNLFRIREARELEKEGKLDSQAYLTFLNASGLENVQGLLSGDTQAYDKIMADFQKGAKDVYGGRISNQELEQFLKTIPNLYQSPAGRARIFNMMEYWNKGDIEKQKVAQQIRKENGGVPPYDLHEQVIERSKPRLDHIAKQFREGLKEALTLEQKQQGSNRASVAAAHIGGKLAGNVGKGLLGAGVGALGGAQIGAAGGPIGALGGAALGGLAGLSGASIKSFM